MSLFHNTHPMEQYLVLQTDQLENPFFLSSQVMRWDSKDKTYWIISLYPTLSYWRKQAHSKNISLRELIEQIVYSNLKTPFSGVFCHHPWQGLLTLKAMNATGFRQLIRQKGHFGQKLFSQVSWDIWWQLTQELGQQIEKQNPSQSLLYRLPTQLKQMKTSMQRLQVKKPIELKPACSNSIEKRYGPLIRQAWDWTFNTFKESSEDLPLFKYQTPDLKGFPWKGERPQTTTKVQRLLMHAMNQWDLIENQLKEDFLKLSKQIKKGELIQGLSWSLTLENLEVLVLKIQFRNPYDIRGDQDKDFRSALHQAYYAFEAYMQSHKLKEGSEDEFIEYFAPSPIIAWQLELEESLYLSPQSLSLLPSQKEGSSPKDHWAQVLDLENKLPLEIKNFRLNNSFVPGNDFYLTSEPVPNPRSSSGSLSTDELVPLWQFAALERPLFVLQKPEPLKKAPNGTSLQFLERASHPWWHQSPKSFHNDFYQHTDDVNNSHTKGQMTLSWISNNGSDWLRHGYFD